MGFLDRLRRLLASSNAPVYTERRGGTDGIGQARIDGTRPGTIADSLLPVFSEGMYAVLRDIAARPTVQAALAHVPGFPYGKAFPVDFLVRPQASAGQNALVQAAFHVLRHATPHDLLRMVQCSRDSYSTVTLSPAGLPEFDSFPSETAVPWAGLLSLVAADGRVRETTVRAMDDALEQSRHENEDPAPLSETALPYILFRVCDWVPQVRAAAETVLDRMLPALRLRSFFEADAFLCMVERSRRASPESIHRISMRIVELVTVSGSEAELPQGQDGNRRFVWRILSARADAVPDSVWLTASTRCSSYARLLAPRHLDVSHWDELQWREQLSENTQSDPKVRRAWMWRLADLAEFPPFAEQVCADALSDPSAIMREAAAYAMRARLGLDPAERYREMISAAAPSPSALSTVPASWAHGLAAVGGVEDIPWFEAWLATDDSRLRAAGLLGLGRAKPEAADQAAVKILYDEQRASRHVAARWLIKRRNVEQREELRDSFKYGGAATRKSAFRVLLALGGMERIIDIFAALPFDDMRATAWDAFIVWAKSYGWQATNGYAPYAWQALGPDTRGQMRNAWEELLSQYSFSPPREPRWAANLLERFPNPQESPKRARVDLGEVPYEAWTNWSHFPLLLEELAK